MGASGDDVRNLVKGVAERLTADDVYSSKIGAAHLARYLFAAHWVPGRGAADLCCGVGYGTRLLAGAGATRVHGIDVSEEAISEARHRFAGPGIDFAVGDVTAPLALVDLPVRVCFEGLEHVRDPDALLENLANGLPDDGVAIVSTPNADLSPSGHSGNPHHVHEYRRREFETKLGARFRSVRLFFQWEYPDPRDLAPGIGEALRSLVPVSVKHAVRRRRPHEPGDPISGQAVRRGLPADHRPMPVTYLRGLRPGRRFGEPSIWIAICQLPR